MKLGLSLGYSRPQLAVPLEKVQLAERLGYDLSSHRMAIHTAAPCPAIDATADDEPVEELLAYAGEQLAHYKCPRSIDFMEQLPRLPTGKLYKRLLKDRYWGREGSRIV